METRNIEYPYLPKGKTIEYVGETNEYMKMAKEVARGSNDQSLPTGAVLVSGAVVLAKASNKTPLSNPFLKDLHKKYCVRRMLGIPSGQKYWLCPGCASHKNHAEYRTVADFQRKFGNQYYSNSELYLWGHWWCCKPCWDKMLEIGIKKVFLLEGSEILFDINNPRNIMGRQFDN